MTSLILFSALVAVGCGDPDPSRPPEPSPTSAALSDIESAAAAPAGCSFVFGRTFAMEPPEARLVPPNSGTTDAASVVLVFARSSVAAPLAIRYEIHDGDCAGVTLRESAEMIDNGFDSDWEDYTGVIPAFARGTHVCWKIAAQACGTTIAIPARGEQPFDYTTQ